MVVRRCKRDDLKRIARMTGGQLCSTLANMEGEETFEPSLLGHADEVVQERISDDELVLIKGTQVRLYISVCICTVIYVLYYRRRYLLALYCEGQMTLWLMRWSDQYMMLCVWCVE